MKRDGLEEEGPPLCRVRGLRTFFPVRRSAWGRVIRWRRAVDGVSFDIHRGRTLGVVGESGCGKTTLGRSILRLVEPTAGTVVFDGVDLRAVSPRRMRRLRRDMQMVFQEPLGSLNPRMTVGRIITEPLAVHRIVPRGQRRRAAAELLERVGLRPSDAGRYPHEFSGGQRQRVGIARAIALKPKFIVCDEPTSALDVSIQSQILNLLLDLSRELGLTYLFIAHNLAVVRHMSDRVAVMYLGRIVEMADSADVFAHPRHPYTMALLAAAPEPDPSRRRARPVPLGEIPDPADPPAGCTFHPRCPFATEQCHRMSPKLEAIPQQSRHHLVSCHRAAEVLSWDPASYQ